MQYLGGVQNAFNVLEHDPLHSLAAADGVFQQPKHMPHKTRALQQHQAT